MKQENKPCGTCPPSRLEQCIAGPAFACEEYYAWLRDEKVWHFTVERDIPISAKTEEEAEKRFRQRYGSQPILGIIRPSGGTQT